MSLQSSHLQAQRFLETVKTALLTHSAEVWFLILLHSPGILEQRYQENLSASFLRFLSVHPADTKPWARWQGQIVRKAATVPVLL